MGYRGIGCLAGLDFYGERHYEDAGWRLRIVLAWVAAARENTSY
jgi:hypothetical protein